MNRTDNPFDNLQNYFDELLSNDEQVGHGLEAKKTVETKPAATQKTTRAQNELTGHSPSKQLESQQSALSRFAEPELDQKEKLQKLLSSAQPKIQTKIEVVPIETAVKAFTSDPAEIQEWIIETAVPVAEPIVLFEEVQALTDATNTFKIPGLDWLPNGLPQWAQARFDVLLFKVSGLTLAVPLISLGQIQPITDELTPLFGQADWFMGLQPTAAGKIRTVNTAKFVMPERYDENFVKNAKYVVTINGVPWGLAVDSVNQPISLQPDEVKWRTDRSKRPWLAGTVKEHMCALLDIPMIGQMLMDADKNAMKSHW